MEIKEYVSLDVLTMFHTGGPARYYVSARNNIDIFAGIRFAQEHHVPYFVLGGGSNILVSDKGFNGIVIHIRTSAIAWQDDDTLVIGDAGVSWDALVAESVARIRYGIENLSGIPGTLGGGASGNIGAYGSEVCESIEWIEALDTRTLTVRKYLNDECKFAYRESIFKHDEGKHLIILRVALRLSRIHVLDKAYKDIGQYESVHGEVTTLKGLRTAVLEIRRKKLPSDGSIGTAGSFFKNPIITNEQAREFVMKFPDAPTFPQEDGSVKISAGWIIDHVLDMRGTRDGDVGTWSEQALVLVNYGHASSDDIAMFAKKIITNVFRTTNIIISSEVIFVGEF